VSGRRWVFFAGTLISPNNAGTIGLTSVIRFINDILLQRGPSIIIGLFVLRRPVVVVPNGRVFGLCRPASRWAVIVIPVVVRNPPEGHAGAGAQSAA